MKLITSIFIVFILFFDEHLALDVQSYRAYIDELSHDEKFLEDYTKWSLELFSHPDYLYGDTHRQFPCSIEKPKRNYSIPTSVHTLRPNDIQCIGAIGDSFTAGLGAHAITPNGLLVENRGISWSVGGDYTYSKLLSIPNILRKYNPELVGFSTSYRGRNMIHNQFNVAKSGDRAIHLPYQAELLLDRIKNDKLCDWNKDWKVITLFAGVNDLCSFCEDSNATHHTPEQYMSYVQEALDKLYKAPLPRTLVNLVLVLDVRGVKELNTGGHICPLLHKKTCPCAAFPTVEQAKILDDYVPHYHQVLLNLVHSGRYEERDDFTVVIQPFLAQTKLPYRDNDKIDWSYFAPDCFHFSGKGHSQAALSLWNNMLEPVGGKQWSWHIGQALKCPTKEYPYIFTSKNSAKALSELHSTTTIQTTNRIATTDSNTVHIRTASPSHHKNKKSKSDSPFNKMKFTVITVVVVIIIMLLILGLIKQRQARVFHPGAGQYRLFGIRNGQATDDEGEVEIWSRSNTKSNYFDDNKTTKTHGRRISFE